MNLTDLSDCELLVMKCLWDVGSPMTVAELIVRIEKIYGKSYKETTVYTFLKRLKDKGYVSSYKKGTSYFSPLVSEDEYLDSYSRKMSDFLGRESANSFLSAFYRHQNYTEDEWEAIRSIRDDLE
ncbi:MAG: BlaI/MecI/CopY family transcriptional regulator [Lachnospiraceae bacterium]|nr:BlaI/MecI/CopY family transcriptional regulator [Lachnospiraceae bacterium]MCD8125718.1 BlaI/MecI/CopY family transcriptional regulator [Lachnospiraceae bacterium]